jgi:hypothetical protein
MRLIRASAIPFSSIVGLGHRVSHFKDRQTTETECKLVGGPLFPFQRSLEF